jgi:phosphoribosylformimino-5-aminoimidazole carboxamide ribotide isomerase
VKIIPAVDIAEGRCVRLLQGERGTERVYGDDPLEVALHWQGQGAERLHVVDLDAAFGARGGNRATLEMIIGSLEIPVQVGGGVRDLSEFRRLVGAGAAAVVFGTAAVEDPELVRQALSLEPDKVVVGVDAREGRVALRGWEELSQEEPISFGRRWVEEGVTTFVYTDILRDGLLEGPNVAALRHFARSVGTRVIASGGVGSLEDLRRLRETEIDGVEAVIVGRALYEGLFSLTEAAQAARSFIN